MALKISLIVVFWIGCSILSGMRMLSSWKEFFRDDCEILTYEDDFWQPIDKMALVFFIIAGPVGLVSWIIAGFLEGSFSFRFWKIEPDD